MLEKRIDKANYYLDIAKAVAERSTCLRKKIGCVIVNHDEIISTGYNGAPRGRINCTDLGYCCKKRYFPDIRHAGYDACRSIHAEQNAIISASRKDMIGGILYLAAYRTDTEENEEDISCCQMCRKMIINAGIEKIIIRGKSDTENSVVNISEWITNDDLLNGKITY